MTYSINQINNINADLMAVIDKIENSKAEDETVTDLVSELQVLIETRQKLVHALVSDTNFTDRDVLEQQFDLTQTFIKRSRKIMDFRQSLLQAGNTTKRQINVYKAIDSNR
ncbi:flagella biosynthesis chaperone for FliD, FliT [Shewanella algicola]|uniref:flagella biosynthesis chaperone for FliD, FliT n=1 Tax=Shewanella algicola TaxID=640633 RepID=UPI00249462F7|nr:flagella biosynthesis chaperone for FliD, FliT [Shewanella algicola]